MTLNNLKKFVESNREVMKKAFKKDIGDLEITGATCKKDFTDKITSLHEKNDFIKVDKLFFMQTAQRSFLKKSRLNKIKKIAENLDPYLFDRVKLARVPGIPEPIVFDLLGRSTAAILAGCEYVPKEDMMFESLDEVRNVFLTQHDNETRLTGWDRHQVAMEYDDKGNAPRMIKNILATAKDIQHVIEATGVQLETRNAKSSEMSVETIWGYVRKCVTNESLSEDTNDPGHRESKILIEAIEIFQHYFGENEKEVIGQNLEALCCYLKQERDAGQTLDQALKKVDFVLQYGSNAKTQKILKEKIFKTKDVANKQVGSVGADNFDKTFKSLNGHSEFNWEKFTPERTRKI